jgi:hypothetical protein
MTINQHLDTFAGLDVWNFDAIDPPADYPAARAWRIAVDDDEDEFERVWEAFLASPDAADATAVVIGSWGYASDNTAPVALVAAAAPRLPELRHLFLGDIVAEECEISWISQDDVTPILTAYPALQTLRVRGSQGLELRPLRHEALRELALESGGLPGEVVRAVGECDLPALRRLELWLGTDEYYGDATVEDLAPIRSGARLPALTSLGLRDAELADEVAAALASAPIVARLQKLDLSLGALSDVGATALLAGQPLTHLRRLDLRHHFLSKAMRARLKEELRSAGVKVKVSRRQRGDDGDRYIAVSE